MNKYRLGRLRFYGWLCLLLGALGLLNVLLFYPFAGRGRIIGPQDPLWQFVRPLMMLVNLSWSVLLPLLVGYLVFELARVHERLNRLGNDLEALRYRESP